MSKSDFLDKIRSITFSGGNSTIQKQREEMHDDLLQPHSYNKDSKKLEINREFVDKYPDKAHLYYSPEEMRRAGMPKLVDYTNEVQAKEKVQKQRIQKWKDKVVEKKNATGKSIEKVISEL